MAGTNGTNGRGPNGSNGFNHNGSYQVIGKRPIRHDGVDKVTGYAKYGGDIQLPGMLVGAVLRSPYAHARIVSIDTSEAEAYPGVVAVVTHQDMPQAADKVVDLGEGASNMKYASNNVLADDKVLYHYHAVAAVAATDRHTADEAIKLIKVEYERLPVVQDVRKAMEDDAPILLDDLRTDELGKKLDKPTNVAAHIQHKRGDVEAGFAEADVIVEREFIASPVHQGYIEPHNGTARWNADGSLEVWTSTQGAFAVRKQLMELLRMPAAKIKVTPMEIGGGFGGKIPVYLEPVAALLSKKAGGRPVKVSMTRSATIAATGPNSGSYIKVKVGAKQDGTITAATAWLAYEAGAYPGSPVGAASATVLGPYRLENLQIDGYDVIVNKPKAAAYRAPGTTNAAFASETVMDEVAEKLGIDPLEFRLINGAKEGDRRPSGPAHDRIGYLETVQALKDSEHYNAPLEGKYRGRGVATGVWFNWGGQSSATAALNPDGTVNLIEGSTDIGGTRTSLAMQLAETLGISEDKVNPQVADTNTVAYNDVTGGSRTTFSGGWVTYELGHKLLGEMKTRAADLWELDEEQISVENGVFSGGDHRATFEEMTQEITADGSSIIVSASVHPQKFGPGFGAHCVDLEVDPETGKVTILRYTAAQDVGKAIHPSYVEGQIQGGAVQGIGWALNEEYFYNDEGLLMNSSLLDYRMPTALDLPMIDCILVEEAPFPHHPYGVRGVGEVPIVPPPAAVANAIYQAIGIRFEELPMSPPKVMQAIWSQQGEREMVAAD